MVRRGSRVQSSSSAPGMLAKQNIKNLFKDLLMLEGMVKFKVFISIMLVIIILLLILIASMLAYAGYKTQSLIKSTQKTFTDKTIILNKETDQINKSLQNADLSLQQITKQLENSPLTKQIPQLP
jgi:predicted PurR-regulated permease PerM